MKLVSKSIALLTSGMIAGSMIPPVLAEDAGPCYGMTGRRYETCQQRVRWTEAREECSKIENSSQRTQCLVDKQREMKRYAQGHAPGRDRRVFRRTGLIPRSRSRLDKCRDDNCIKKYTRNQLRRRVSQSPVTKRRISRSRRHLGRDLAQCKKSELSSAERRECYQRVRASAY